MSTLSEKEGLLLSQIQESSNVLSQKILSEKTGISVGLINAVLKKMIHRGYVKAKSINKKKVHYLLTTKGSAQMIRRTYLSIVNTVRHYQQLETKIRTSLLQISQTTGKNKFLVAGEGELPEIIKRVVSHHLSPHIQIVIRPDEEDGYLILDLSDETRVKNPNMVNLLPYLS